MQPFRYPLTSQPQSGARIKWSNPITRDLVFDFEACAGQVNLATGIKGTLNPSGISTTAGRYGIERTYSGSQELNACSFGNLTVLKDATKTTFDILVKFNSGNPTARIAAQWDGGNQNWDFETNAGTLIWVPCDDVSGNRTRFDLTGAFPTAGYYRIQALWLGGAAKKLVINGVDRTASITVRDTAGSILSGSFDRLQIGSSIGEETNLNGSVVWTRAWKRAISNAELKSLTDNPWQILANSEKPIFIGVGAAGGGGKTAVAADAYAAYLIRNATNQDLSSAFNIRGSTQTDINPAFNVRGLIQSDESPDYSIRGSVSTDITPAYSIMSATVSPTLVQPNADTTTGGWISSTASSLSSCIDETIPSDTDFISYTTPAAAQSFISTNSGSLIINPAAKSQFGLTSVWTGTNPDVELIKNSRTDISATTLRSVGKAGPAIRFTNAPEIVKIGETKDIISSTAASILVLRRCLDTTNRQSTVFTANTVNTSRCSVHVPWSDGTIYFDFGDFNHGEGRVTYTGYVKDLNWEVLVFTAGPVDNLTIWRRGVRLARNAAAPVYRNPVNVPFGLGGSSYDAPSDITETALCITSNTEWSPAQVKSLSENPWQIFSKTAKPVIITAGGPTCEMVLAESAFPGGVNQVLKYRASSTTASTLTVTLKQGSTTIMTRTHTLSGTITEYSDTLTSGEIAAITSGPISVTLGCS